jgi:DNA anti-recombination protein RmuC
MGLAEQVKDLADRALELYREVVTIQTKFEGLDKEVHRMMQSMERLLDKYDADATDLRRRVEKLEAAMDSAVKEAVLEAVKTSARAAVAEMAEREARALKDGPPGIVPGGPHGDGSTPRT